MYEAEGGAEEGSEVDEEGEGAAGAEEGEGESEDLLVRAVDVAGREWSVFERDPEVDAAAQRIVCTYDFEAASGERTSQTNVHHYALPAQLRGLLDATEATLSEAGRAAVERAFLKAVDIELAFFENAYA